MISANEFSILYQVMKNDGKRISQREMSVYTGFSLGKVNSYKKKLVESGAIDEKGFITTYGKQLLQPYKVDNAIIMAAGLSSRFTPLSIEKPKALLNVKGEILIERLIKQLHDSNINNITIVVGYMKEKMYYLADKYNVKIVVNEDYYRYNNPSTLIRVLDELKNTYICSSDNYYISNVFEPYVYSAYYSGEYTAKYTEEYCMYEDNFGNITQITIGGQNAWFMIGHAYFDKKFSDDFKKILVKDYKIQGVRENLWESILKNHIDELSITLKKYECGIIKEFDSLDELREFDDEYINNVDSAIMVNICNVLNCKKNDITRTKPINTGLTNTSFSFCVGKEEYVYRHPGSGTETYINRKSEAASMEVAKKLGLDNTFIYMDCDSGWKISKFINNARTLDYHNMSQVKKSLEMMRKLHECGVDTGYDFDIFSEIERFYSNLLSKNYECDSELISMLNSIRRIKTYVEKDSVKKCLCHSDCYDPNFLIDDNDEMYLIDWEYSGMADPASDLGTYIACSDYKLDEVDKIINLYLGHKTNKTEYRHFIAYIAILSFYWYIWSIYQESVGKPVGDWQYKWYCSSKQYIKLTFELYQEDVK